MFISKISALSKTGFFWMLVERITRLSFAFITSILIAKNLGPSQFGEYSFNQSILSILSVFILLGFDGILVRHLITSNDQKFNILKSAFILRCLAILFIFFGLVLYFIIIRENNLLFIIMSVSLVFQGLNIYEFYFQSQKKIKIVAFSNLTAVFVTTFLKIYGVLNDKNVLFFGFVYTIEFFLVLIINLAIFKYLKNKSYKDETIGRFKIDRAVTLLKESWPMVFSGFIVILYMRVDQIVINHYFQNEITAIYITATKLVEIFLFLPTMLISIFFPYLASDYIKKETFKFERNIQLLYIIVIIYGLVVGSIFSLFNKFIIENTFGQEYIQSTEVLQIYGWVILFAGVGVIRTAHLKIIQNTRVHLAFSIIGLLINTMLNLLLVPKFGINAAAYSTLISYSIQSYALSLILFNQRSNIRYVTNVFLFPFRIQQLKRQLKK